MSTQDNTVDQVDDEDYDYAVSDEDLQGGGGGDVKPRGLYTGVIEKAETGTDRNGKLYLKFQIRIMFGSRKNGMLFENYLTLNPKANKYQVARRNSFYKAIGLQAGEYPPGTPKGRKIEELVGTYVDVNLEHEYQEVPGEDYSLTTSKSKKSQWVIDGWEDGLDSNGNLVRSPGGTEYDAPVKPRETLTFYALSDEFAGIGDPDYTPPQKSEKKERPASTRPAATRPAAKRPAAKAKPKPAPEPEAADDDDWGV